MFVCLCLYDCVFVKVDQFKTDLKSVALWYCACLVFHGKFKYLTQLCLNIVNHSDMKWKTFFSLGKCLLAFIMPQLQLKNSLGNWVNWGNCLFTIRLRDAFSYYTEGLWSTDACFFFYILANINSSIPYSYGDRDFWQGFIHDDMLTSLSVSAVFSLRACRPRFHGKSL